MVVDASLSGLHRYLNPYLCSTGATEDAINQAREAFHAHLADKRAQSQQPDFTDEELLMEETEFEREYSGIHYNWISCNYMNRFNKQQGEKRLTIISILYGCS